MNLEKYNAFISEQKDYFNQNLQSNFKWNWNDSSWYGGSIGSGWLLSRSGKSHFCFGRIKRLKGIEEICIDSNYQEFIKSVLILSYRKANSKASPQKLYAEFLILKRWYSALIAENSEKKHPCDLSTLILNKSFSILINNSSKANLPDHAGTYLRLQEMLNHYGFTEHTLEFSQKYLYINSENRTPRAKKTKALIDQLELDEDDLDKEKLISIRTFINIISLISLCKTKSEKIVLNLMLLLIVTGLRSTEVILLKTDALIKQPILDPVTKEHLTLDGTKQYTLGIKYFGAKGSGIRVHWVEPSSVLLVESIFSSVLILTTPHREFLKYIRSKNCRDFFPKKIDDIQGDLIELDDMIESILDVNKSENITQYQKRKILINNSKWTTLLKPKFIDKTIRKNKYYYDKNDLNEYVKYLKVYNIERPINHVFNFEGELIDIPFEELLFIHEFRSTNTKRLIYNKNIIIPFTATIINTFFGNAKGGSVFEKYNLLENNNEYSKILTHIPRHNINTFLALSGLSEHLQAMLMGRVDIKQNQYYQHLALKQRKVATSLLEKNELVCFENDRKESQSSYPIESIKNDGIMYFSEKLDLENNLKMNLQTFDSKNEVASYLKESFFDEYFQDIAESFNELIKEDKSLANSLVQRHSCLHPLPFGGCMREIAIHDCPKRLACQSGDRCGNFALTGRKGELETLQNTLDKLVDEFAHLEQIVVHDLFYSEMLEDLRQKILYLSDLKTKALARQNSLTPIPVFPYGNAITKLPTTLSELFAIEQQKIETKEA